MAVELATLGGVLRVEDSTMLKGFCLFSERVLKKVNPPATEEGDGMILFRESPEGTAVAVELNSTGGTVPLSLELEKCRKEWTLFLQKLIIIMGN